LFCKWLNNYFYKKHIVSIHPWIQNPENIKRDIEKVIKKINKKYFYSIDSFLVFRDYKLKKIKKLGYSRISLGSIRVYEEGHLKYKQPYIIFNKI